MARAGNRWAVASLICSLAPLIVIGAIVALQAGGMASSNAIDRVGWVAWPVGGVLALVTGAIGWRRPGHRAVGRVGFFLGLVEVFATILIVAALLRAFRGLG